MCNNYDIDNKFKLFVEIGFLYIVDMVLTVGLFECNVRIWIDK